MTSNRGPASLTGSAARAHALPVRRTPSFVGAAAGTCLGGLVVLACAGKPAPPPEQADSAGSAEPPAMATGVNATVIVGKCPDVARINVRTAQDAIQKLVGPCAKVPGGSAHFSATLLPGGKIDLASPEGDPAEGVVPTCVLQNRLVHRVPLKNACALDVQLDERTVVVAPADGAPADAGAPPDGG